MIPLSSIRSRVRTKFEAESASRWEDEPINSAINEGLDELSERTLFYERYVSIPIESGRTYYDTRGFVPEGALQLTALWDTTVSDWIDPANIEGFDTRWEEATGPARRWFTRGAWWFGVNPSPSTDATGYYRLYFAGLAPHLTHDQAVLADLPDDFVDALVEYALYELEAQDGETSKALLHWKLFDGMANDLAEFVKNRMKTARTARMGKRR